MHDLGRLTLKEILRRGLEFQGLRLVAVGGFWKFMAVKVQGLLRA